MRLSPSNRTKMRLITTFGLGYMRPASGTWGSLPPALYGVVCAFISAVPGTDMAWAWYLPLSMIAVLFGAICVRDGDLAEHIFNKKDPGQVVADETSGMALTMVLLPPLAVKFHTLPMVGLAFLLFRLMDIVKPWPARGLQRVPGGWGVLIDDLVAGVYAALAAWGVVWALGWKMI